MSEALWALVELACAENNEDRSTYVRRLCVADLEARGFVPGCDATAKVMARVQELQAVGVDVDAVLTDALRNLNTGGGV